uniref:Uncharacterized protein n=1 Tax=Tanacetum cinerariifolium TaxID=118510 RepID=A0A6L2JQ19_TANCI|nr:hypothetical protein [Tanacetum cinerariifolium]
MHFLCFSYEWKPSSNQYFGQAYYDLSKDSWGWSWKERWIAVCPWEARVIAWPKQKNKTSKKPKNGAPKQVVAVKPKKVYGKGEHYIFWLFEIFGSELRLPAMCLLKCQVKGYEFGKASGMAPSCEFSLCETKQVSKGWVEAFCVTLFVLKAKLNTFFGQV